MSAAGIPLPVISAWDPRATTAGSIDPLGALRPYTAIANTLLPGVTTITTRARYLSWVCAGLRLLDECSNAPEGGRVGRARRQRVLAWERLVALATGRHAVEAGFGSDHPVWTLLRGVSYVRRAVAEGKCSPAFPMLKNQAGVGGVGTYWVALVAGGLVEDGSGALTPRGATLADAYLAHRDTPDRARLRKILAGDDVSFPAAGLTRWGASASLDVETAPRRERTCLADALLEPVEHRRVAAALGRAEHASSSDAGFAVLHQGLADQEDPVATRLAAVVAVARPFEAAHAALLDRFDRVRASDTRGRPVSLRDIADLVGGPGDLARRMADLQAALDSSVEALPRGITVALRAFLLAVGPALSAPDAPALLGALLRHHERVQAGKTDASRQPKQPWVERQGDALVVSPRFALDETPAPRPEGAFTHPYRLEPFAGMLDEVDGWEASA